MLVKDVMTGKAIWVSPETVVRDVASKMRELEIGSLPVSENDKLIGMITDRDIALRCCADGFDPETTTAREVMSKGVTWCFDDQEIGDAAHVMEQKHIRRLPVLNRSDKMVGFLSVDDISVKVSHELGGEVLEAATHH